MAGRASMRHADKHKGFWRPRYTIPPFLVDYLPGEYPVGRPLKDRPKDKRGNLIIVGPSTRIRATATGIEAERAQLLIDQFGATVVYPAMWEALNAIDPGRQEVEVLDLRRHQTLSFYTPTAMLKNRLDMVAPSALEGLNHVSGDIYVLDDLPDIHQPESPWPSQGFPPCRHPVR